MAQLVQKAKQQCPQTKIALSGYSQGAMVVHNAVKSHLQPSDVSSVVLYGDPELRESVGSLPKSQVKEFCGMSSFLCARSVRSNLIAI